MAKYEINQIEEAEREHDWTYKMTVRFSGSSHNSNHLSITKEQLEKIKEILK